ncbi:MAG: hypothetical protein ACN4GW_00455 [Desulforhopalus sp.]
MMTTVFLTTSLASSELLRDHQPNGIILNRLPPSTTEKSIFDFSRLNIVATIDLNETTLKSATDYLIGTIVDSPGEHYIDLTGKRIPISETDIIYAEIEKIDRHFYIQTLD